jgi:hypothetical protein
MTFVQCLVENPRRRRTRLQAAAVMAAVAFVAAGTSAAPAAAQTPTTGATPTQRTGKTAASVPLVLKGRTLRITVPKSTKRGDRIEVRCGRITFADLLRGTSFSPAVIAEGKRLFRTSRRMEIRLDRDVSAIAEWCEFETQPNGRGGAAVMKPQLAPPPAHLVAGPGVREGKAEEAGGRFLVDGSRLTLRTTHSLPEDIVLFLACYATDPQEGLRTIGARALAIGKGRRAVSADLGADVEGAAACFAESSVGGDLFITYFGVKP